MGPWYCCPQHSRCTGSSPDSRLSQQVLLDLTWRCKARNVYPLAKIIILICWWWAFLKKVRSWIHYEAHYADESSVNIHCKLAELGDLTTNQSVLKICCQRTAILELHFPISSINSAAKIFTTGGFKGLFRINTLVPCDFAWKCESPHTWSWGICLAQVCHFHTYSPIGWHDLRKQRSWKYEQWPHRGPSTGVGEMVSSKMHKAFTFRLLLDG